MQTLRKEARDKNSDFHLFRSLCLSIYWQTLVRLFVVVSGSCYCLDIVGMPYAGNTTSKMPLEYVKVFNSQKYLNFMA